MVTSYPGLEAVSGPGMLLVVLMLVCSPLPAVAQATEAVAPTDPLQPEFPPPRGEMTRSMGFPSRWMPYVGALVDWNRQPDAKTAGATAHLGVNLSVTNPVIRLFGLNLEGYVGGIDSELDAGGRFTGALKPIGLRLGVDYSSRSEQLDFILTAMLHLRRGGVLGNGSFLRIDWLPGRNNSWNFGFEVPIGMRWPGNTRPKSDHVTLPRQNRQPAQMFIPSAELTQCLADVDHAAAWINTYATVYTDQDKGSDQDAMRAFIDHMNELGAHVAETDALYPEGHTYNAEVKVYHQRLDQAFLLALGRAGDADETRERAAAIAVKAREILFSRVVAPYNRLLGQLKAHDSLWGYGSRAQTEFNDWLHASALIPQRSIVPLMYVFDTLVDTWEQNRRQSRQVWGDARMVWLPLRYVFKPEEIDGQKEMDAVIGAVVGRSFTVGNDLAWIKNEMFQGVVGQMIRDAEHYHVLWIHDIRGYNDDGNPDAVAYMQSTRSYLSALIDRVQRYDSTGKMPTYIIILDEWYFAANKSTLWLDLLADPLEHRVKLPEGYEEWATEIAGLQDELRTAVAGSHSLQLGAQTYGRKWLENLVKVHINITNPADFSFRSNHILSMPLIPDMMMRDHRKISFYDISELDPSRGAGVYTGMGIGEHYTGKTWDDRGALARGPALVALKTAARDVLLSQGFKPAEIPQPLRPLPYPDNYELQVQAQIDKGWHTRAMQVQNSTGFAPKHATLMKGLLYDLMPPGSHLYIPDSLWNNSLWGGMMIGAALRGCTVLVVSPSVANAPSAALPTMARSHRILARLFAAQQRLDAAFAASSGQLHVGIYDTALDVGDIEGQFRALVANFQKYEFLQQEFPLQLGALSPAAVDSFFQSIDLDIQHLPGGLEGQHPKLHLKVQLFRSVPTEAWRNLITRTSFLYPLYMAKRATQVDDPWTVDPWASTRLTQSERDLVEAWTEPMTQEQRDALAMYLTAGSQNQDYRSMIEDGEALFVISGEASLTALFDFLYIMGISTWVESAEELDKMLPEQSGFGSWLGEVLKNSI